MLGFVGRLPKCRAQRKETRPTYLAEENRQNILTSGAKKHNLYTRIDRFLTYRVSMIKHLLILLILPVIVACTSSAPPKPTNAPSEGGGGDKGIIVGRDDSSSPPPVKVQKHPADKPNHLIPKPCRSGAFLCVAPDILTVGRANGIGQMLRCR